MFLRARKWMMLAGVLLGAIPMSAQNLQSFTVNPTALFFRNPTGTALVQTVTVTPAPSGATATAAMTYSGNTATWLTVASTQSGGTLTLTVTVAPASLSNGVYTGRIDLSATGFVPRSIPVSLAVIPVTGGSNPAPAAALIVTPNSLSSTAVQGGAGSVLPPVLLSNAATENYDWTATSDSTWLTVTPASGHGDTILQVVTAAQNLSAGSYTGIITISSAPLSVKMQVTFTVAANAPPLLVATPTVLTFQATQNGGAPASQVISVSNAGSGSLSWTAQSALTTGGNTGFGGGGPWLSINPIVTPSLTTPNQGQIVVTANPGGLPAGLYSGVITVTQAATKQTIPVYMRVGKATVTVSPRELFFAVNQTVGAQASSTITLSGGPVSGTAYTIATASAGGGNWLQVLPLRGTVAANGTVTASLQSSVVSALTPGIYYSQALISLPGSGQESTSVRAVLKVFSTTDTPRLQTSAGGILAVAVQGAVAGVNTLTISMLGGALTATPVGASFSTVSGGNWLQVLPQSANVSPATPGSFTVNTTGNGLLPGTYLGKIVFTPGGTVAIAPLTIPVTLVITPPGSVTGVAAGALTASFLSPAKGLLSSPDLPNPLSVRVVDAQGVGVPGATVVVTSSNSEPPVTLRDSGGGLYTGLFRALTAGPVALVATATYTGTNGVQVSPPVVTTMDLESPASNSTIYVNGVVSAASYAVAPTPVSPGSLNSVFGLRIAGTGGVAGPPFPLPAQLGGASFTFGGLPGALIAAVPTASGDQVNLQVPFELEGQSSAEVVATLNGTISPAETLVLGNIPSVFATNQSGTGTAAVLHAADFTAVTTASPATGGELLAIYATGLGPLNQTVATGTAAPGNTSIQSTLTVAINGLNAPVVFAGLAPGFAGLYQINVVMPTGAGIGNLPLTLTIAGNLSTGSVTIPAK